MSSECHKVICDETNNTPEDAANRRVNVDIILPALFLDFVLYGQISIETDEKCY